MMGALVFPDTILGMMDASITRSPEMPYTLKKEQLAFTQFLKNKVSLKGTKRRRSTYLSSGSTTAVGSQ